MLRGFSLKLVHRRGITIPALLRARQSCRFLESGSLYLSLTALHRFPFRDCHLGAAVVVFVLRVFSHAASPRGSPVLFHVLRRRSESAARAAGFPAYGHAAVHLNLCHSATAISSQRLLYSFSACFPTRLPRAGALFYFMSCGGEVNPPLAPPDFRRMATRLFT